MPTALDMFRSRQLVVTVYTRCDECAELKQDVAIREFWTSTGLIRPSCCAPCGRDLWRKHYGGLTYQ
jgi:hypothetical protein